VLRKELTFCPDARELFKRFKGANVYTAEMAPLNNFGNFEKTLTINHNQDAC
jgi:hypothetical protein